MAINGSGLSGSRKTWPLFFFFSSKIKVQIENMFNTSNLVQVPYVKRIFMSILFFISELQDRTSNTFFNYERSNPNTHHTTPPHPLACMWWLWTSKGHAWSSNWASYCPWLFEKTILDSNSEKKPQLERDLSMVFMDVVPDMFDLRRTKI